MDGDSGRHSVGRHRSKADAWTERNRQSIRIAASGTTAPACGSADVLRFRKWTNRPRRLDMPRTTRTSLRLNRASAAASLASGACVSRWTTFLNILLPVCPSPRFWRTSLISHAKTLKRAAPLTLTASSEWSCGPTHNTVFQLFILRLVPEMTRIHVEG